MYLLNTLLLILHGIQSNYTLVSSRSLAHVYKPKELEVFQEDELTRLLKYLYDNPDIWNLGILLALNTGLRIGELSALKHEDIKQDFIRIQRTEVKIRNKNGKYTLAIQDFPKSCSGCRDVLITDECRLILDSVESMSIKGEYLFENSSGIRIRSNTFNKRLTNILNRLKIPHKL